MKKIKTTFIITLAHLLICTSLMAQAPQGFEYQAVVRNASGNILINQAVGIQITLKQGSPSGTNVYQETFSATTNLYGLVNLQIGSGTTGDDFTTIDWAAGPYFVEVSLDVTGGTNYSVMGTSQLLSVPYALHAKTVEINDACSLFSYYYADRDNDGFGDAFNLVFSCSQPTGYVSDNTDCNDNNTQVNPSAAEICNNIDDNCDGQIDEGVTLIEQYPDMDGDDYGDYMSPPSYFCNLEPGFSLTNDDCNDDNPSINSGTTEICGNTIDENCDGIIANCSVQERLDNGETPCQIFVTGIPVDSLYGKNYAGGLIFYLDNIACTGIVAAPNDQSSGIQWHNGSFVSTGATGTSIGDGQTNTSLIVSVQGSGSYAAQVCDDLLLNGYSDWFLPSIGELDEMYNNLFILGYGNFSYNYYKSSSESSSEWAYTINFANNLGYSISYKLSADHVRAVRTF